MSDPTTAVPASGPPSTEPQVRSVEVELEFRHSHHVPSSAEYPSEEILKAKTEENLTPGLFRVYVKCKQPKEIPINVITIKGIDSPFTEASNLDADELERTILSICHRHLNEETKERTTYLIEFRHKTPPGHRPKKREVTFSLSPLERRDDYDYKDKEREPDRRDAEAHEQEERWRRGRWVDPPRTPFQEAYSPFSQTSRDRRSESWKANLMREDPDRVSPGRYDDDRRDEEGQRYEQALATRRGHLFSPDMMFQFNPERLSSDGQRDYAQATLPFAMLNNSMGMSYQAFGAAFDMVSSAAREQSRLHAMQMQTTIDREKELMKLPLKFLEIEASSKGHQAEILQESQRNYLGALRMRGEMSQRELGYERQNMQSQYQLVDSQRQLTDQQEKHQHEQGETFRRDLLRGIGPMALQGLGLFLDYFGQQKLGAAAKMSGTMVEGMMQNIEKQQAAAQGPGPSSTAAPQGPQAPTAPGFAPPQNPVPHPGAWPGQPGQPTAPGQPGQSPPAPETVDVEAGVPRHPPQRPTIPRRNLRLLDVATLEEIQMQPLRSLCRMADAAFSQEDRARVQQILNPQEWGQLEQAFRGPSDQECMQSLGIAMFTIGQDPNRYERMMASFTPGQRELLNMIGDVVQGKISELDPNYEVRVRPPMTRMRTVLQSEVGDAPSGAAEPPVPSPPPPAAGAPPVPPANLDDPPVPKDVPPPSPDAPPVPPADLDAPPVPEEAPGPSASPVVVAPATEAVPRPSAPHPQRASHSEPPSFQQQMLDQMQSMQGQLQQMQQEGLERDAQIRVVQTKVEQPTRKKASRSRSSSKKKKPTSRGNASQAPSEGD